MVIQNPLISFCVCGFGVSVKRNSKSEKNSVQPCVTCGISPLVLSELRELVNPTELMLLNHVALCPASMWKELVLAWKRKLTLIIFSSPFWGSEISHYKRGIVNSSRSWTCYPWGHFVLLILPSFSMLLGFFPNS